MVLSTAADLLEALTHHRLLLPAQLNELARTGPSKNFDSDALGRQLVERGWLTPYQRHLLLQGRASALLLGPYVILDCLGEGGTGQIFKARHTGLNRVAAVKVLRQDLLTDAEMLQRFLREIKLTSKLAKHPHLVHAFDAGPVAGTYFLAMEFIEGIDLEHLVRQIGPLPIRQACDYLRQAALGLQHAHEHGLVHLDIKPANIIVTPRPGKQPDQWGTVKVLDLGLARLCAKSAPPGQSSLTLTLDGTTTMGTPDYMAPEQALDLHRADIRADIYSLGCTFYYLLTGKPPFAGGALAVKLMRHQQAEPPDLTEFRSDVPAPLISIVRRMLAKSPEERYQTPAEVVRALAPFCPAQAPGKTRSAGPRMTRRRFGTALCAILLLLAAGIFLMVWGRSPLSVGSSPAVPSVPDLVPTVLERGTSVASFRMQFQSPRPGNGWQYLCNSKGPFGNPQNYVPLQWASELHRYNSDGKSPMPRPDPAGFLFLQHDHGHPGRGTAQAGANYFMIAAYTIQDGDGPGDYQLTQSSLGWTGRGAGLQILVHINDRPIVKTVKLTKTSTGTAIFDVSLGTLKPRDTVYVGVGPDGNDSKCEFTNFNFGIRREAGQSVRREKMVLYQEDCEGGEPLAGWSRTSRGGQMILDGDQPHQGRKSFRFQGGNGPNKPIYQRVVEDNAIAGGLYRVVCWARANKGGEGAGAQASLEFVGSDGVLDTITSRSIGPTSAWEPVSIDGSAPKGTRQVRLVLRMASPGDAWFDDIIVTREPGSPH